MNEEIEDVNKKFTNELVINDSEGITELIAKIAS